MNKKKDFPISEAAVTVDTRQLQQLLNTGRGTATKIGEQAGAKITVGKCVLWDIRKIKRFLSEISE